MINRYLSPIFALLIFVAHLNCVVEHQLDALLGSALVTSSQVDVPLPGSTESGHCEVNCLCKGATLTVEFSLSDLEENSVPIPFFDVETMASSVLSGTSFSVSATDREVQRSDALPLRAQQRCIILQSFLI